MTESDRRLAEFCRSRGAPGIILRRRSNIAWAADGADVHCDTATSLGVAALLWSPARKSCLTDTIEAPRLRAEEPFERQGWAVEALDWWEADRRIAEALSAGYACDFPDDPLYEQRATLTDEQQARARALGRDAAEVVERVLREDVRPGMTEHHLGGAVAGWLRDRGVFAHVCLIASDDRIARYRHPTPTAKKIDRVAMVAVCAQRQGLIVSLTRLVHFGVLGADLRRRHDACVGVDRALHAATTPGARWCDILASGVAAYAAGGFAEEWKLHHQGGPMGFECRDFKATPTEARPARPRQLVGWNPTISGTKSEDTVLTAAGPGAPPEVITRTGGWPETGGRPDILVRGAP
jgi:antitoxin VapB